MSLNIVVAELWPKLQLYETEARKSILASFPNRLLYILLPRRIAPSHLDNLVNEISSSLRRSVDIILIRAHSRDAVTTLKSRLIADRLYHKFEQRPAWVLFWEKDRYKIDPLTKEPQRPPIPKGKAFDRLLDALREAEFVGSIRKPGVVLPAVPEFHYQGPNEMHYSNFLRVGSALFSLEVLDSIAFWLLPYASRFKVFLFDSPTILSIGLNIQCYLSDLKINEIQSSVITECFRSYTEPPEEVIYRVQNSVKDIKAAGILFLSSVTSRGRLADRLLSSVRRMGIDNCKMISLFAAEACERSVTGEVFCTLPAEFTPLPAPCTLCESGSQLVRIQPDTYSPEISAQVKPYSIRAVDALAAKAFVERYNNSNSIFVHRDQHDKARHHMLYIDVTSLLGTRIFNERLIEVLQAVGKCDIILCPEHSAAKEFARTVSELTRTPVLECDENLLGNLQWREREALHAAKDILIVDDVIITGNRLRGYKQFLARSGFVKKGTNLKVLVGVARPPSNSSLRAIGDMFHDPKNFAFVEKLLLPDWRRDECAWCWELARIRSISSYHRLSDRMEERYSTLVRTDIGLRERLFLHWGDGQDRTWKLGPGSVFCDVDFGAVNEAELFLSVASTLQLVRDSGFLQEHFSPPVCKVLEPDGFLVGRFYAHSIQASILRASHCHDLRSTLIDTKLVQALDEQLKAESSAPLRSELLLAIAQGKLPRTNLLVRPETLSGGEHGVQAFLSRVLGIDAASP